MMTQAQIVTQLRRRQGKRSDTEFAAELGVSAQYWYLVRNGRRPPGPKILKSLGMVAKKVYVSGEASGR